MDFLNPKLIIYDGSCGLCTSLKNKVLRLNIFPEDKIVAYQKLAPEHREKVNPDRFKNEMALIDLTGKDTLYGAEGIAYLFSGKWGLVRALFRIPGVFAIFHFLYRILAYNRFAISNPNFALIRCSGCEPEVPGLYRFAWYALSLTTATLVTLLFGAAIAGILGGISRPEGADLLLVAAGSGWVLQGILVLLFMDKAKKADYLSHLGTTMVIGVAILLPAILWLLAGGYAHPLIPAISVLISFSTMLWQHSRRIKFLELPQGWTVSWILSLLSTATTTLLIFNSQYPILNF